MINQYSTNIEKTLFSRKYSTQKSIKNNNKKRKDRIILHIIMDTVDINVDQAKIDVNGRYETDAETYEHSVETDTSLC